MNVFPDKIVDDEGAARIRGGLQLRDYFAAQALAGLLAGARGLHSPKSVAEEAYEIADFLLEERER